MAGKPTYKQLEQKVREYEKKTLEHREKMDALRESEDRYRTILESIVEGYYEVDIAGNFTFFNDSLCKITGYSPEELMGMNNRIYTKPEKRRKMYQVFNEVYRTGLSARITDYEVITKDKSRKIVEVSTSLRRGRDGEIIGFRGIVRDVTDRKLAEEAVKESEEKHRKLYEQSRRAEEVYRSLLHSSADAIVIYDLEGRARYVSPTFTDMFGWTLQDVEGKKIPFLPDSEREPTMAGIREIIEKGDAIQGFETKRYTKDGNLIEVSISGSRYHDHEGRPAGMLVILRDITQTRKLQAELQHAQKMKSVGTIASGVAHNFRNILSGILVNSQVLEMKHHDDKSLMEVAQRLNSAVRKGARLVDGLVQFSRKESSREFKRLDLSEVIQGTYNLISKSFGRRIDIQVDLPGSLPVMGDHSGLSQVIMNLSTNALDAMPDGGKLRIEASEKGGKVEVIISDTGEGMDKETQEKCFDPFFSTKDVDKGTGLGLSTAYGIVKEHGGDIHVYSELDKGTTFRLHLPLAVSEEEDIQEDQSEIVHGGGQKILIVDDDRDMLKPMEDFLEGIGYSAASVSSGENAIVKYASWQPDAVLIDRNMPEMDGITCAKMIIKQDPGAKVILVSGYDEDGPNGIDYRTRMFIAGYLTKPIDMVELGRLLGWLFTKSICKWP
ncbi:MAG: PAS domain S-box protein [Thermodesulfobacteriota bacterium]|nr:PAS domain S-box protein [Thermodesulfobacteriota bacterium]